MATDTPTPTPKPQASDTQLLKPVPSKFREWLAQSGPTVAAGGVALLFCLIIGSLFWPFLSNQKEGVTLLRELSSFEVARGLITFLVAVTTVGIALILTVYVVVTLDPNAEKKFGLGKEVLTGLIGVLGTIVGFYFGGGKAEPTQTRESAPIAITLKQLRIEPTQVKPGEAFTVSAVTSGAKGDLEYILTFNPESVSKEIAEPLTKPEIKATIKVPANAQAGTVQVTLQVRKKGGAPVELGGDEPKATVKVVP